MSEHHASLSPSRFPAFQHCIHYESLLVDSESRRRGTKIHEYAAKFLREQAIGSVPMDEVEFAGKGEWVANETRKCMPHLCGVEHRVQIFNCTVIPPEVVTFGTCDAWGYEDEMLILVDAKSGQKRDYRAQMAVYALGLMEDQQVNDCMAYVLYCDLEEREIYPFTWQEAEDIVFDIVARVNAGTEPPQENDYCHWCAKRPTCPVWVIPAQQALSVVEDKTFDLESLKQDPIKLGEFLDRWDRATKLVEEAKLKDAAKSMLTADPTSVPGWQCQTVNGRLSYDDEEIEEIIGLLPELGIDRARSFVNVDRKAFEQAWKSFSKKPIPVVPTVHAGTYTKLIRKK